MIFPREKPHATANHLLGNTVTLNLIVGLVFMVVCLLLLDPILPWLLIDIIAIAGQIAFGWFMRQVLV